MKCYRCHEDIPRGQPVHRWKDEDAGIEFGSTKTKWAIKYYCDPCAQIDLTPLYRLERCTHCSALVYLHNNPNPRGRIFCRPSCQVAKSMKKPTPAPDRYCTQCGVRFTPKRRSKKTCSDPCRQAKYRGDPPKERAA